MHFGRCAPTHRSVQESVSGEGTTFADVLLRLTQILKLLAMKEIKCRLKATGGVVQNSGVVYPVVIDAGRIGANALVDLMVRNCNVPQSQVLAVLSSLAEMLAEMLTLGHSVEVPWLGFFTPKVKGRVVTGKNGVRVIDNARGDVAFKLKEKFAERFSNVIYKVVSSMVHDNVSLSNDEVAKVAETLIKDHSFFSVNDFADKVMCSPNYARKVLGRLVEKKLLACTRIGRLSVFCQYRE